MKNQTIMQYFEWYLPDDGKHWQRLADDSQHLADIGISKVWLPPACKATGTNDVGYGIYDLYDLGEFDQKGAIRTKYGTKDEYLHAIAALKEKGIRPIADVVLNHKAGGDEKETFAVLKMNPDDRQQPISEPYEIEGWTHFTFPGRNNQYSDFQWHWHHFSGTDYDAKNEETGVFMILGENKGWADNESVDSEYGNYDYLMFTGIDYKHPDVTAHVRDWLKWFVDTTGITGLRLDAIKHIDQNFMRELIQYAKELYGDEFYVFGEYWHGDFGTKDEYLNGTDFTFDLVDVGLHMNFFNAAQAGEGYDLTQIFQGSLVEHIPTSTVTFVDNHDTQRGQSLQSTVDDWFKPMAYGIILLRERGLPCVFYGDYYGIDGEFGQASFREVIDKLLYLRANHAYGEQIDYLDAPNCIGWTRLGNEEHPDGLAAIISNSAEAEKRMHVGILNAGKTFVDYLGHHDAEIDIDDEGWAVFPVCSGSISVWAVKQM